MRVKTAFIIIAPGTYDLGVSKKVSNDSTERVNCQTRECLCFHRINRRADLPEVARYFSAEHPLPAIDDGDKNQGPHVD